MHCIHAAMYAPCAVCTVQVCLFYKDQRDETWVAARRSHDGVHFGRVELVMPRVWGGVSGGARGGGALGTEPAPKPGTTLTHNLAVIEHAGEVFAVGSSQNNAPNVSGAMGSVYLTKVRAWCHTIHKCRRALVSPATVARAQLWLPPRRLFSAAHAGCVERAACMCTACALHMHRMCTPFALHVHCMCTACARHTHGMRTAWARHAQLRACALCMHCACTALRVHQVHRGRLRACGLPVRVRRPLLARAPPWRVAAVRARQHRRWNTLRTAHPLA